MYRTVYKTQRFDTDEEEDLREYSKILSNPLCTIVEKRTEKISDKEMSEGEVVSIHERVVMVVSWQEKKLL